jgi:hypothetical protein
VLDGQGLRGVIDRRGRGDDVCDQVRCGAVGVAALGQVQFVPVPARRALGPDPGVRIVGRDDPLRARRQLFAGALTHYSPPVPDALLLQMRRSSAIAGISASHPEPPGRSASAATTSSSWKPSVPTVTANAARSVSPLGS